MDERDVQIVAVELERETRSRTQGSGCSGMGCGRLILWFLVGLFL